MSLVVNGADGVSTNSQQAYVTALTAFQSWQIQYFGGTNNPAGGTSVDADGDGLSNQQEFLAGTDPTNSVSLFGITAISREANDIQVTWMTGLSKTNALERAAGTPTNFLTAVFTVTNTVGPTTNYLDVGAATNVPAFYYRIRLVP